MLLTDLPESFQKYVSVQPNGCWFWKGSRFENRPIYRSGKVRMSAFQFAWEQQNGPMPAGHGLYRACFGIACANPEHRTLLQQGLGIVGSRSKVASVRRKREARDRFAAEAERLKL